MPESDYEDLVEAVDAAGDRLPKDARLLTWFLRSVMQVDDLTEYELTFTSADRPLDGLYVEQSSEEAMPTVHLLEAKMGQKPVSLAPAQLAAFAQATDELVEQGFHHVAVREVRAAALSRGLGDPDLARRFEIRKTMIVAGQVSEETRQQADDLQIRIFDLPWLARLARALRGPALLPVVQNVPCPKDRRFVAETRDGRIAVCDVDAHDAASWPGIEDRRLFGLNVRGELRQNRVRTGLDSAIRDVNDHANFIAYHNGLTVLCRDFDDSQDDQLVVHDMSVVNGAQSLLAFHRNRQSLQGGQLRVLVKFVTYIDGQNDFATEVARRSNTQTAVNPRNLRANDARQLALEREFATKYPQVSYITKPDATHRPHGEAIANDDAAQWLCATYTQRPWLAVKRTELFRDPSYSRIFTSDTHAAHVLLCKRMNDALTRARDSFPDEYQGAWRLTTVLAMFVFGRLIEKAAQFNDAYVDPASFLLRPDAETMLTDGAVAVGRAFHAYRRDRDGNDDYKVDFKRENTALRLARYVQSTGQTS